MLNVPVSLNPSSIACSRQQLSKSNPITYSCCTTRFLAIFDISRTVYYSLRGFQAFKLLLVNH